MVYKKSPLFLRGFFENYQISESTFFFNSGYLLILNSGSLIPCFIAHGSLSTKYVPLVLIVKLRLS